MLKLAVLIASGSILSGLINMAAADVFVLNNSNGGDGFVTSISGGIDLFGSDNGATPNYTTFLATALVNETLTFSYTYTTNDCCGAAYDPAGYSVNGVTTQLTASDAYHYQGEGDISGSVTLTLLAGQSYGFYVYSLDSSGGRADIAVTGAISAVPEPSTWAMMLLGFATLGYGAYRKTSQRDAALAH